MKGTFLRTVATLVAAGALALGSAAVSAPARRGRSGPRTHHRPPV